jgi:hypothetical protein
MNSLDNPIAKTWQMVIRSRSPSPRVLQECSPHMSASQTTTMPLASRGSPSSSATTLPAARGPEILVLRVDNEAMLAIRRPGIYLTVRTMSHSVSKHISSGKRGIQSLLARTGTWLDSDFTDGTVSAALKFRTAAYGEKVQDTITNSQQCGSTLFGTDDGPIAGEFVSSKTEILQSISILIRIHSIRCTGKAFSRQGPSSMDH